MKPLKIASLALSLVGLAALSSVPASAQQYRSGHGGYVTQSHQGYVSQSHQPQYQYQKRRHNAQQSSSYYNGRGYGSQGQQHYRGHKPHHRGQQVYQDQRGFHGQQRYQPRYVWNPNNRVIRAYHIRNSHRYRQYRPHFRVGHRFHGGRHVIISDYHRFGLYHPPRGHRWVRHNNDAYLQAAGTGLVAGIIIGALASN